MQEKNREKCINSAALDSLITAHDGDVALLYLHVLRNGGLSRDDAARELCRTMDEISGAAEKLSRMGLLGGKNSPAAAEKAESTPAPRPVQEPEDRMPEYTAADISRRSKEDGVFAGLLDECAKVIGHSLSTNDMKLLFGIYDYLALPPEVIMELLNYCGELYAQKYGSGRRPSVRTIEKQAYSWANQEILTLEQAERYINFQRQRRSSMGSIAALLGIKDRHLSPSEERYIGSWLDMGFGEEAIAIAYDRTVTATGSLKWPYMNKILLNWHEAGIHSADEINEKDGRRGRAQAAAPKGGNTEINMDRLRDALNKI